MAVFNLEAKLGLNTDAFEKGLNGAKGAMSKMGSAIGSAVKTTAKITAGAVAAGTAAVGALVKSSVEAYANYEQLVGGIETLFGTKGAKSIEEYANSVGKSVKDVQAEYNDLANAQSTMMAQANEAYKTAGMSANQYMETATSFAAALRSSTDDATTAAKLADTAITDMSDNANKMGTDVESIKTAYAGFAKQNYTMLDNLKLGYGGTKTEMERLISDANKLRAEQGKTADLSIENYSDVVEAIHEVQVEMGIYGTTAKEASTTIQGSLSSMKSAWGNMLVGIADENADFGSLVDGFVETLVGSVDESGNRVGGVINNIMPRILTSLQGIGSLVQAVVPIITDQLPAIIETVLPALIGSVGELVTGLIDALPSILQVITDEIPNIIQMLIDLVINNLPLFINAELSIFLALIQGIADNLPLIITSIVSALNQVVNIIMQNLPLFISAAIQIIMALAQGIVENISQLIGAVVELVNQLVVMLSDPVTLSQLLDAAIQIIEAIAWGLIDNLPLLIESAITLIKNLVVFLLKPENLLALIKGAIQIILALGKGLIENLPLLIGAAGELIDGLVDSFMNTDWLKIGKDVIDGILNGLKEAWTNVKNWFKGAWKKLTGDSEDELEIHSPSKVFARIGKYTAEGFGVGFQEEFKDVSKDVTNALSFDTGDVAIGDIAPSGNGSVTYGGNDIVLNVYGAEGQDVNELADIIEQKLVMNMNRRGAVYG